MGEGGRWSWTEEKGQKLGYEETKFVKYFMLVAAEWDLLII